ncbi:hypothetical protein AEQ67_09875 [Pseudomonas sp. RIT-PI-q]|nr:hypothetical protein AEQ67_09875 [Pseudomonas sp. RIT-PI-q]
MVQCSNRNNNLRRCSPLTLWTPGTMHVWLIELVQMKYSLPPFAMKRTLPPHAAQNTSPL